MEKIRQGLIEAREALAVTCALCLDIIEKAAALDPSIASDIESLALHAEKYTEEAQATINDLLVGIDNPP